MRLLLIFVLTLLCYHIHGQDIILENLSVKKNESFSLLSTYYNKVILKYNHTKYGTLRIKGENIDVTNNGTDTFFLRVLDNQRRTVIRIYDRDSVLFDEEIYVDNDIRLPALTLGCYHCDIPELSSCLCNNFDSLYCEGVVDKELKRPVYFTVLSFNVKMRRSTDEVYYSEYLCGNIFSEKAKAFAKTLKYKDQMLVDPVIVKDMYGNVYSCKAKRFMVLSKR